MVAALISVVLITAFSSVAVTLPPQGLNSFVNGSDTLEYFKHLDLENITHLFQQLSHVLNQEQARNLTDAFLENLEQKQNSILHQLSTVLGQDLANVKSIDDLRQLFYSLKDENFQTIVQKFHVFFEQFAQNQSSFLQQGSSVLGQNSSDGLQEFLNEGIKALQQLFDLLTQNSTENLIQQSFANLARNQSNVLQTTGNQSNVLQQISSVLGQEFNFTEPNKLSELFSLEKLIPIIKPIAETFIRRSLADYEISSKCVKDMMLTITGLLSRKEWALRMLDAFGKPGSELMNMHTKWLGSYGECTAITATTYSNDTLRSDPEDHFTGKYCRIKIELEAVYVPAIRRKVERTLDFGSCVADSCSAKDLEALVLAVAKLLDDKIEESPAEVECQEEKPLKTDAIVVTCILSVLGVLLVFGTLYDVVFVQWGRRSVTESNQSERKHDDSKTNGQIQTVNNCNTQNIKLGLINDGFVESEELKKVKSTETMGDNIQERMVPAESIAVICTKGNISETKPAERGPIEKALLSFSVYTNGVKILSTNQAAGSLGAVNGIRFLSMAWIILGHTYFFALNYDENVGQFVMEQSNKWTFMAIPYATVSVDTFFTLSGLLVGYLTLRELKKVAGVRHLNWFQFYFHRFWRLTPPYMLTLMVYTVLLKYWSTGPQWPQNQDKYSKYCAENWWTNLLYVNNLVRADKMCMAWSWYLSNDMQFYILSPLIFIPLFYQVIVGGLMSLLFLAATIITPALIAFNHKYPVQIFNPYVPKPEDNDYEKNLYLPCYNRMGPYIVGLFTGYLLYRMKCQCHIPKVLNLLGWLFCIGICCAVIYGPYTDGDSHILTVADSAAYYSLVRTGWGIAVSWIVFSCATGHGGWINELLSWKAFIPLGRLTYMAYLVHPIVMLHYYMSRQELVYFTNYEVVYLFIAQLVLSYGVGFVTSLSFEAPMMGLEKAVFRPNKKT